MKILVTGASRGIGAAIAEKFIGEGHTVIGLDILPPCITHQSYSHVVCDIRGALPDIDGVNILINCAGVQNSDDIEVNLKATMRVTERYGFGKDIVSVLFIASSSASTGSEFPEYAASKGGIVAYMKNVALRLAPRATSNSLSPGGVIGELNAHIISSPELYKSVLAETLLNKWAEPEEIADWAYFMTAVNRSMTAQDVLVDNGEAAKANFIW